MACSRRFARIVTGGTAQIEAGARDLRTISLVDSESGHLYIFGMNKSPPAYVSEAAGTKIVIKGADAETGSWLKSIGFIDASTGDYMLSSESDEQKAEIFAKLRDRAICFSHGREWSPCEVFEYLRDKKLLSDSFKEIAWQGPGKWIVRDR